MGKSVQVSVACPVCAGAFSPKRIGHLYCSETCRKRNHKQEKAKETKAKRARKLAAKFKKLGANSFGKYLVRELRRAGSVEVLRGHTKTSLGALVRLRTRCNTLSGYDEGRPRGTYELSHIYAAQGKDGLGRLHPRNLVIAPKAFNRSIGASGSGGWDDLYVDYSLSQKKWILKEDTRADDVLKLARKYLKDAFDDWLSSFTITTSQHEALTKKLIEQGHKKSALIGLDLDALKDLASSADIAVFTADSACQSEASVLCKELARKIPNSKLLSLIQTLVDVRWATNQQEVLYRLQEKDIEVATQFVCQQGWRQLHRMEFKTEWRGVSMEDFFTDKKLEGLL
jgi:hypothetical protein